MRMGGGRGGTACKGGGRYKLVCVGVKSSSSEPCQGKAMNLDRRNSTAFQPLPAQT